jgi:hypothetical protein
MSVYDGPKITTNGLVLALDAGNRLSYVSGSTTWNDISNNANNGALINGPTFNTEFNGSLVFDGVDDYVNLGNQLSNFEVFTTSIWINWIFFDTTWKSPIGDNLQEYEYHILLLNNTIYLGISSNYTGTSFIGVNHGTITQNQWYNFTITKNTSNLICFYKNETLLGCTTKAGGVNINKIGKGFVYDNAKIPIVQIYNRALSAQEVLQNYNTTKTRFGL